jgi:hypothetical protein
MSSEILQDVQEEEEPEESLRHEKTDEASE